VQGDKQVVDAFQELSRDKDAWIREAAVKALEIIAIEDDEASKLTVTHNLQDSSWEVQARSLAISFVLSPARSRARSYSRINTFASGATRGSQDFNVAGARGR
jgi:HEAT repeat protein